MSRTIFVVEGNTGEYSDHIEWPVKAYTSEDAAKEMVLKCQVAADILMAESMARGDMYYKIPAIRN